MGRPVALRTLTLGSLLATALCLGAAVPAAGREGPSVKDQRLSACYADMLRLCPGPPEKRKLKSCIRPRRHAVSPACRAWLDAPG